MESMWHGCQTLSKVARGVLHVQLKLLCKVPEDSCSVVLSYAFSWKRKRLACVRRALSLSRHGIISALQVRKELGETAHMFKVFRSHSSPVCDCVAFRC